jgi:hypothetical protein
VTHPQPRPPTTHDEWAAALCAWFFRPEHAHSHVLYLVDDVALEEIYAGNSGAGLQSLVAAIRPKLRWRAPRQLFANIESTTRTWRRAGGDGPPPCLPLLAITVLAASRMARSSDRSGHNYYLPFIELLDLEVDEADLITAYGESIPDLWTMLQWWLDEKHSGQLGFSTIVSDSHFTRIGYADSQTLFHSSDSDKLTRFLKWLGLPPGEPVADDELLTYFRLWAAVTKADLTTGAQAMLDEDERPRQLMDILRRTAAAWHGVARDERGRSEAAILLTLRTFPRPSLGLVAERPPGFPTVLHAHHDDHAVELVSDDADELASGWYRIPFALTAAALKSGITIASKGRVLRLAPAQLHVLRKDPGLGSWASTDRLRPGEQAWLLVRNDIADRVEAFLRTHARPASSATARWSWVDRQGLSPPGWRLVRDVIIDDAPAPAGEGLEALRPRHQIRLSVRGGLPLPLGSNVYLTEGEPDLWLPEGGDLALLDVTVDGLPQTTAGDLLHLCQLELDEGAHELHVGPISRAFSTQRTTGDAIPAVSKQLGHVVTRDEHATTPLTLDATTVSAAPDAVVIVGATILEPSATTATDDAATTTQRPLVLPVAAKACILLGATPGQITWVPAAPAKPTWMEIADLQYRVFEVTPSFPVVWVLTERRLAPTQTARLRSAQPPGPVPPRDERTHPMTVWATTILEWQPAAEAAANALWDTYMDSAELVLEP